MNRGGFLAEHNSAPATWGTGSCFGYQMVRTTPAAEAGDIHSQDFRIVRPAVGPEMCGKDPRNVVPNSCNGCHAEWGKDKAGYEAGAAAFRAKFGD